MYPVSCTNTHHGITDLLNHEIKNTKTWISWEWDITFLWNKKILNLYLRWHILRSYCFVAEVTCKYMSLNLLHLQSDSGGSRPDISLVGLVMARSHIFVKNSMTYLLFSSKLTSGIRLKINLSQGIIFYEYETIWQTKLAIKIMIILKIYQLCKSEFDCLPWTPLWDLSCSFYPQYAREIPCSGLCNCWLQNFAEICWCLIKIVRSNLSRVLSHLVFVSKYRFCNT